jgi:hypothetical protein
MLKMSNTTDKMLDRYVYLHIDPADLQHGAAIAIQVKMDDEGIVVDAWSREDEVIASAWKTYNEMGVEVKEIKDE